MSAAGRRVAVVDIDGVLADAAHRQHHLDARPRDWDAFFAAVGEDAPIDEGLRLARDLAIDHDVVLLSGRPERARADTTAWLDAFDVPYARLLLRRDSDRRPAATMKAAALERLGGPGSVDLVVDDDAEVIARLEGLGYRVRHFGVH